MGKENILLRETQNPPLITTDQELTFDQVDSNFIEIYNQFVSLSNSSQVPLYDPAKQDYIFNDYVNYNNQIYRQINATPTAGVTPGTDPLYWRKTYAADMVVPPNEIPQSIQQSYNVGAEILTGANGAVKIEAGTSSNSHKLIEFKNIAKLVTYSVDGNGDNVSRNIESTRQYKSKTLYGNTTTTNDFVFDCDNGMIKELDLQGQAADGQITITNPIEGNTYSLVVIQGSGLFNISLPTGWWINDFVFSFSDLLENDRAIVTMSYVNGVWNFAAKKLTLISNP
jgi:hypothetical protein